MEAGFLKCVCFIVTSYMTLISKPIVGDCFKMTERNELRNKHIKGNLVKSVTTETSIACFRQCNKLIRCSSISYNPQNKICYMYSRLNTYSDGTMEDGRMYYLKGVKNCPTEEGYTYKSSLMLCIKFYDVEVTYQNAVSTCHSENSSLVRIDSPEVQKVVYSYLTYDEKFTNSKAYIQGNRKQNTPEWEFDDGTLISYMPWNLNQKQPEAYDQIFLCFNVVDQGMWHDCIGTQLFRFVCESHRSAFAKFGCGVAPIRIETQRYENIELENRACNICTGFLEDEAHVYKVVPIMTIYKPFILCC